MAFEQACVVEGRQQLLLPAVFRRVVVEGQEAAGRGELGGAGRPARHDDVGALPGLQGRAHAIRVFLVGDLHLDVGMGRVEGVGELALEQRPLLRVVDGPKQPQVTVTGFDCVAVLTALKLPEPSASITRRNRLGKRPVARMVSPSTPDCYDNNRLDCPYYIDRWREVNEYRSVLSSSFPCLQICYANNHLASSSVDRSEGDRRDSPWRKGTGLCGRSIVNASLPEPRRRRATRSLPRRCKAQSAPAHCRLERACPRSANWPRTWASA